jgi:hypothetical protein
MTRSSLRLFSHGTTLRGLARLVAGVALLCAASLPRPLAAQTTWTACAGSGNILCTASASTPVGIGTSSPGYPFQAGADLSSQTNMTGVADVFQVNDATSISSGARFNASFIQIPALSGNSTASYYGLNSYSAIGTPAQPSSFNNGGLEALRGYAFSNNSGSTAGLTGTQGRVINEGSGPVEGITGVGGNAQHSGTGTVTNSYGADMDLTNSSTGTMTTAYGVYSTINNSNAAGTISTAYGLYTSVLNSGIMTTGYGLYVGAIGGTASYGVYQSNASNQNYFAGNIGIGVTNPVSKLAVNGTISASEVVVTSSPADYVFDPAYRLAPLAEVSAYVKENHHLPEIPSAKEVGEKGVSLGDMQSKLLAKIEELTLHMIHAEEENQALRKRVAHLEEKSR